MSRVFAPPRAAETAAAIPPGPPPTTQTSTSRMTFTSRAASATVFTPYIFLCSNSDGLP